MWVHNKHLWLEPMTALSMILINATNWLTACKCMTHNCKIYSLFILERYLGRYHKSSKSSKKHLCPHPASWTFSSQIYFPLMETLFIPLFTTKMPKLPYFEVCLTSATYFRECQPRHVGPKLQCMSKYLSLLILLIYTKWSNELTVLEYGILIYSWQCRSWVYDGREE